MTRPAPAEGMPVPFVQQALAVLLA